MGRRGDKDRVDIFPLDDLSPVRVGVRIMSGRRGGRFVQTVGLDIAQRQNLGVRLREDTLQQIRAAIPNPDHAGADRVGGLSRSGYGGRGSQQEIPAIDFHEAPL
jgi:hypothetical protein